ncbi:hypothetical protein HYH02_014540 [Chlamydomonas schloesseri]|uniref:DUF7876 domain-containing protein n=1 Tax=Chlamydomonas schloesseri TaxID=2026947 RepID=A0A835VW57_9CHLO|nr:hypothetical protein HYH02_014540 [Chlamydomonas schloesseri]|eukprot:KAG2427709.1 hypothetical protein HYH02_014540 [Chlamydomonas schloesseri]
MRSSLSCATQQSSQTTHGVLRSAGQKWRAPALRQRPGPLTRSSVCQHSAALRPGAGRRLHSAANWAGAGRRILVRCRVAGGGSDGEAGPGAGAEEPGAAAGPPGRDDPTSQPSAPSTPPPGSYDEVVLELARSYDRVQNPALSNVRYSIAVTDFIERAVLAYECGYAEADVAAALGRLAAAGQLAGLQGFDAGECVSLVAVVWVTLALSPLSVKRWATVAAVSEPTMSSWRGFVAMIVHGYFERRMAWYPLDRLALELSAVQGRSLPQEVVAEHARIVFTTLEKVYPQFATD